MKQPQNVTEPKNREETGNRRPKPEGPENKLQDARFKIKSVNNYIIYMLGKICN